VTFFWAYVAGALTLINPCVLPLLPIILVAALQKTRLGPLALAAGLILAFTVVGVAVTAFGKSIGIDSGTVNRIAAGLMIAFGIILLIPRAQEAMASLTAPVADGANERLNSMGDSGLAQQFMVGLLLGAVWSPCIGPTLGGAISLAATGENLGHATLTMLAFGFGVSTILMLLAYGSREVLTSRRDRMMRWMPWAKPLMGIMLLLVGLMIWFHLERKIEGWLLDIMPVWLQDLSIKV